MTTLTGGPLMRTIVSVENGYPLRSLPPLRGKLVFWIGVGDLGRVLAQGHLDQASTETPGVRAVCMTRSHRIAMIFANLRRQNGQGGVLAIDAERLRHRHRVVPHRDQVLTTKDRADGYDEQEERVYGHVPLDGVLLGAWRSVEAQRIEEVHYAMGAKNDPWVDDGIDWDAAFSNANCALMDDDGFDLAA
jgi:hypothetical protein